MRQSRRTRASWSPRTNSQARSDGYLGEQSGDLGLAKCLVKPNADSRIDAAARDTTFTYGVDGVCHQLANKVLYTTGATSTPPLTVTNARRAKCWR